MNTTGTVGISGADVSRQKPPPVATFDSVAKSRLATLLHDHFDAVWRTARRLGLSAPQADDVAQEVYVIATRRLDDMLPGSERSFLIATAVRTVANYRRLRSTSAEVVLDMEPADPGPGVEELLEQKRRLQLFDRALEALPPELRTVFVLYEVEGLSGRETALALGLPKGTIMSRLRRARGRFVARMRRLLAGERRSP